MDQYPRFVAPIDPKKVEADADEADRDRSDDERAQKADYVDLFSARES